jgi:D-glycero-D-manno-heptose 1,7-bisphosphate phosphatase
MQAVVLVGGVGSRLGSLAKRRPKPLLDVAGRPFIEHSLLNLRRFGFDSFLLLAGHLSTVVEEMIGPDTAFARSLNAEVKVVVEPRAMGTGGALAYARDHLAQTYLLTNGDTFFDFNVLDLTVTRQPSWLGRIALRRVPDARRYGLVETRNGCVTGFLEKPAVAMGGLINGGVYWLKREVAERATEFPCSLEADIFPMLAQEGRLEGAEYTGLFVDIGVPEDLARAGPILLSALRRPAVFLDRDGTLNHDAGYTHRIEDFRWVAGVPELIKRLNDAGILVFVVSNQSGVARGYYGLGEVEALHRWMNADLMRIGAHIDDFRFCPHHPQGQVPDYSKVCGCRKPQPGMIEELLAQWSLDPARCLMIGDKETDAEAARRAGIAGIAVATGNLAQPLEAFLERHGTRAQEPEPSPRRGQ